MKIAYLMMVHRNPRLLERAIRALTGNGSGFYIHIDKKSAIQPFADITGENVHFCEPRKSVFWAEFSYVDALFQLIRKALDSVEKYDYFVHMQGSDYPLVSSGYVDQFFGENQGAEFISMVKMPAPGYPLSKIKTLRYTSDKPVRRFLARALARFGFAQRDFRSHLGTLDPYAGDACWALSRAACEYILNFAEANPKVKEYFFYTHAPEEMMFHTILGNSSFRERARRSLLYRDWPKAGHHPEMLGERHAAFFEEEGSIVVEDQFGRGEVLFARKFSDDNLALIHRIDAMIERKERTNARVQC